MNYKVAETFDSIQGEAFWAGQRMFFIRLAGCNVGRYIEPKDDALKLLRIANPKYSICTSVLGSEMLCDSNYYGVETYNEDQLIEMSGAISTILLTGGEPLLWNLSPLINAAWHANKRVHIETSGTLPIKDQLDWITIAPKKGFLKENYTEANEWKFLVETSMGNPVLVANNISKFLENAKDKKIFIMPINTIDEVNLENTRFAFEVIKAGNSNWRLGCQMHKFLKFR